jgi:hypothetical protein
VQIQNKFISQDLFDNVRIHCKINYDSFVGRSACLFPTGRRPVPTADRLDRPFPACLPTGSVTHRVGDRQAGDLTDRTTVRVWMPATYVLTVTKVFT